MDSVIWKKVKYFDPEQFDDPNYPESGKNINGILLFQLEKLRKETKWPIITHAIVGGCVDVDGSHGHSNASLHLISNGARACDFHFKTDADPRLQYREIERIGFGGIGIYYNWRWGGKLLPIGFHVDVRPLERYQRWVCRKKGEYLYLLGR